MATLTYMHLCLVMLVLALGPGVKDSLRTKDKSLVLALALKVKSLALALDLALRAKSLILALALIVKSWSCHLVLGIILEIRQ